jgi:hypothetical protein
MDRITIFGGSFIDLVGFFAVAVVFASACVETGSSPDETADDIPLVAEEPSAAADGAGIRVEFSTGMGDDGAMFPWRLEV